MGFYIRKSLRAGPLRFNLSKSGIGVSAGIKGFRIGTGPRGNYVNIGRNGLYYRRTIPSSISPESRYRNQYKPQIIPISTVDMQEISSGNIFELKDSTSSDLLSEMNDKQQKMALWPIAVTVSIILLLVLALFKIPLWGIAIAVLVVGVTIFLIYRHDQLSKTVILFYDMDDNTEKTYKALHEAILNLTECDDYWHISSSGEITGLQNWKRHAGADTLVRRSHLKFSFSAPPYVSTNVIIPTIHLGRLLLYFFPDRLFIYEGKQVGAISYSDIKIEFENTKFIETGSLPRDAKVIDSTWKYVNKNGGPDRRFKDNKQLPIVLYSDLFFKSSSGLNELIQLSRPDMGINLLDAIEKLVTTQSGVPIS